MYVLKLQGLKLNHRVFESDAKYPFILKTFVLTPI